MYIQYASVYLGLFLPYFVLEITLFLKVMKVISYIIF